MNKVLDNLKSYNTYKHLRDSVMAGAKTVDEANTAKEAMDHIYTLGIETAMEVYKLNRKNKNKQAMLIAVSAVVGYKLYKHWRNKNNEK